MIIRPSCKECGKQMRPSNLDAYKWFCKDCNELIEDEY